MGRNLAQVLPPVQGLFARTAKDDDHPLPGILRLHRLEQLFKAQAVVGVVHDGGNAFVGVLIDLHPPRHPRLHQSHVDAPLGDTQALAHGDGGQGVLHVEEPRHGQPELPGKPGGLDPEENVVAGLADVGAVDGGGGVLFREGDEPGGAGGGLQHPAGLVGVQVDHCQAGVLEDAQLGGEVVLKIRVLDGGDVVVADVQEHGGGELHAHHPVILQGLGGDLHGQVVQPRRGGVGQMALQVQGLGGGEVRLEAFYPVVGVDGADDPALGPLFARLILVKNIL